MGALAEAGVELVGENRLDDLEAKHERWGDALHVGLHRQPAEPQGPRRPAARPPDPLGRTRQRPRRSSTSTATSGTEVLIQVNVAGEEGKGGVEPDELGRAHRALPGPRSSASRRCRRSPRTRRSSRPHFARLAELAAEHGLAAPLDGDEPGLAGRGRGGGDDDPPRQHPVPLSRPLQAVSQPATKASERRRVIIGAGDPPRGAKKRAAMAVRDTWNRALVYFGLAEDPEYRYDDELRSLRARHGQRRGRRRRRRSRRRRERAALSNVRRLRRDEPPADDIDDIFADDAPPRRRAATCGRSPTAAPTSRSTSSPRATSTTPRRSPTASSGTSR